MERQIIYFNKPGKENTVYALHSAKDYLTKHGLKTVVIASSSGDTALLAADFFKGTGAEIITVGLQNNGWCQNNKKRSELEKSEIKAVPCTHYLNQDIANAYRCFSQGTKVAFEIAIMAAEKGLISATDDIVSIGGTGFGSDTVLILKPVFEGTKKIFDVKRVLCLPQKDYNANPKKVF